LHIEAPVEEGQIARAYHKVQAFETIMDGGAENFTRSMTLTFADENSLLTAKKFPVLRNIFPVILSRGYSDIGDISHF
jgi:hypothetical protein